MRVAWITDPHLDHLQPPHIEAFCRDVNAAEADAVLIGGDIAVARSIRDILRALSDAIEAREFFGEEEAVFDTPGLFRVRAAEDTEALQIPGDLVKDIPIVRWKLFESYTASSCT